MRKLRVGDFRPPHDAVGEGGLEHIGIIAELHHQARSALPVRRRTQIVEGGSETPIAWALVHRTPSATPFLSRGSMRSDFAMTLRQLGEIVRLDDVDVFQRRQRVRNAGISACA